MIYKDYPKDFPLPLFSGYAIQTDMGLIRTGMETGAFKQRRRYNNMPQTFTLSFAVPMNIYYHWQTWVNEHAYQYIKMNLTSYKTQKGCSSEHIVRFISNLSASPMSTEVFTVSVTVEEKFGIAPKTASDWVIARDERAGKGDRKSVV